MCMYLPSLFPTSPQCELKYDCSTTLMFTNDHNGIQFSQEKKKTCQGELLGK